MGHLSGPYNPHPLIQGFAYAHITLFAYAHITIFDIPSSNFIKELPDGFVTSITLLRYSRLLFLSLTVSLAPESCKKQNLVDQDLPPQTSLTS